MYFPPNLKPDSGPDSSCSHVNAIDVFGPCSTNYEGAILFFQGGCECRDFYLFVYPEKRKVSVFNSTQLLFIFHYSQVNGLLKATR